MYILKGLSSFAQGKEPKNIMFRNSDQDHRFHHAVNENKPVCRHLLGWFHIRVCHLGNWSNNKENFVSKGKGV
jgi:hypothetical protein